MAMSEEGPPHQVSVLVGVRLPFVPQDAGGQDAPEEEGRANVPNCSFSFLEVILFCFSIF